jgi:FKBP-type peptidyl-prolyl cis-trans isomerase FkpA
LINKVKSQKPKFKSQKNQIMAKNIFSALFLLVTLFGTFTSFAQDQAAKDDKILQDYFAKNHINAQRTPSGLYYSITRPGSGQNVHAGQDVSMNYIGKFLDGKKFDANVDENDKPVGGRGPLDFKIGVGQVIRGWDEGVMLLNQGSKATLYIPSALAYGAQGIGPIPPNSVLIFDVELLGFH